MGQQGMRHNSSLHIIAKRSKYTFITLYYPIGVCSGRLYVRQTGGIGASGDTELQRKCCASIRVGCGAEEKNNCIKRLVE